VRRTHSLVMLPWLLAASSWLAAARDGLAQEPSPSPTPAPTPSQASAPPVPEPEAAPAPAPVYPAAPPPGASGGGSQASNYFNPSISVIGNFLGVAGHNPVENLPAASLRESEVALQAIVDPYGRADFFLSFSEEGVATLQAMKTGALLRFACDAGAILAQANAAQRAAMTKFGSVIGQAFQIADDILDVESDAATLGKAAGKDAGAGKATLVSVLGIAKAKECLSGLVAEAEQVLAPFGAKGAVLKEAAHFVADRKS